MFTNKAILKFKKEEYESLISVSQFINLPMSAKKDNYLKYVLKSEKSQTYILGSLVKDISKYLLKAEFTLFVDLGKARIFKLVKDKEINIFEINEEYGEKYLDKKLIIGFGINNKINGEVKILNDIIYLNFDDITIVEDCTEFYKDSNDEDGIDNNLVLFNQNVPIKFEEFMVLNSKLKSLEKLNSEVKVTNNKLEKQLNKLKDEEQDLNKRIIYYKAQEQEFNGLFKKNFEHVNLNSDISELNLQESIEYIKNYILCKYECSCSEDLILNMLLGLYSNQIVILAGAPGSGKTSFAKYFADAVGKYQIVSVQANWMDRCDLLGYYNPIDKSFIASVFLEKLVDLIEQAKLNKNVLYFIILDEMNLSTVEYYFADFLSAWDAQINVKNEESMKIELYSRNVVDELNESVKRIGKRYGIKETENSKIMNELEKILNENKEANNKELSDIIMRCKKLKKYPCELEIPKNLKFIGTINKDATTKDLSPKVIDRSYFIRMETSDRTENNELVEYIDKRYLKYLSNEVDLQNSVYKEYLTCLKLKVEANDSKVRVNNRFDIAAKNIINYLANYENNQDVIDVKKLKNFLIAALILPKISMKETQIENYLNNILNNDDDDFLKNIINNMKSENDDEVTYWRE